MTIYDERRRDDGQGVSRSAIVRIRPKDDEAGIFPTYWDMACPESVYSFLRRKDTTISHTGDAYTVRYRQDYLGGDGYENAILEFDMGSRMAFTSFHQVLKSREYDVDVERTTRLSDFRDGPNGLRLPGDITMIEQRPGQKAKIEKATLKKAIFGDEVTGLYQNEVAPVVPPSEGGEKQESTSTPAKPVAGGGSSNLNPDRVHGTSGPKEP